MKEKITELEKIISDIENLQAKFYIDISQRDDVTTKTIDIRFSNLISGLKIYKNNLEEDYNIRTLNESFRQMQ